MTVPIVHVKTTAELDAFVKTRERAFVRCPAAVYHRYPAISSSGLKTIANGCVADWYHEREHPRSPSPEMILGTLAHTATLEPDTFDDEFVIEPSFGDMRSSTNRAKRDAWRLEHAVGKTAVTQEAVDTANRIALRVHNHPKFGPLFNEGDSAFELSAFWVHPDTGLLVKCRFDHLRFDLDIITDLKTTGGKAAHATWQRKMFADEARYHCQAALYSDAYLAMTGRKPKAFVHAVAETEGDNHVANYVMDEDTLAIGRLDYLIPMWAFANSRGLTRDAMGYPTEFQTMSPPAWRLNRF